MSWRTTRRHTLTRPPRKNRLLLWLTAVLVAINVAVIAYHGDPRRLFAREGHKARTPRSWSTAPSGRGAMQPTFRWHDLLLRSAHAAEPAAATPMVVPAGEAPTDRLVGPPAPIDPLAELRTPGLVQRVDRVVLGNNRTAARALMAAGVRNDDVTGLLRALGKMVDLRRMRASDAFKVRFDGTGRLLSVELGRGPLEQITLTRQADTFVAQRQRIAVDTVVQEVTGEVRSSLWEALMAAGEDPRLAQQLVDIFAYEVDFYSEVRAGDKFRLLVEKRYAHGQFIGYGDMLAAELNCSNEMHRAFLSRQDDHAEYFDEHGGAMRKQLMRMPLQYGAVTSRFGRRRHPILGYTRAHNGTDYGVPIGTPVWSVGDGHVIRAGWAGGYGRLVEVSHPNGWVSQYAHLSRIQVRVGQKVRQKQVVGLVGMTGLATGPHLHYGLKHQGRYVNSLAQHFDRAKSLTGNNLVLFQGEVKRLMGELDKLQVAHEPAAQPESPHENG